MMTLAFDTSELLGGVGLLDETGIADERMMERPLQHAERLLLLVEEILEANGRRKEQIDRVCVNVGPGSFTGLRIGLATAKGMCQVLGATLVGVDGTLAYRAQAAEETRVCVVIPSRRDLLYTRWFTANRAKGPTAIVLEHELIEALRSERREWVLVGSGAERVIGRIGDRSMVRLGPPRSLSPSPLKLARIAADVAGGNLYEIEPLYVESGLR